MGLGPTAKQFQIVACLRLFGESASLFGDFRQYLLIDGGRITRKPAPVDVRDDHDQTCFPNKFHHPTKTSSWLGHSRCANFGFRAIWQIAQEGLVG
jgi:hypothetical protein